MKDATPWKLATALLAVISLVLLIREVSRPTPEGIAPASWQEPVGGDPADLPPDTDQTSADREGADTALDLLGEPGADHDEPPLRTAEEAREFLLKWSARTPVGNHPMGWLDALPELERDREQVLPILEDWLRRSEELHEAGIRLSYVILAYAELAGPDALPLLRTLYEGPCRHTVPAALTRIDSEEAVALLSGMIDAAPTSSLVGPDVMMRGTPRCRDLVRTLAARPLDPNINRGFRQALFKYGTEEDRDRLWNESPPGEPLRRLTTVIRPGWSEKWQERLRTAVLKATSSSNEWVRFWALGDLLNFPRWFGPEWEERAREAIEEELANRPGDEERQKKLRAKLNWLAEQKAKREEEQRRRELLLR